MQITPQPVSSGQLTAFNITAATVVKVRQDADICRLVRVSVIVAGSAAGAAHDIDTTGAAAVGNQIAVIPNTAGTVVYLDWPCNKGIVIAPGTGQTLAVCYL